MKTTRVVTVITLINLALLALQIVIVRSTGVRAAEVARAAGVPDVLRSRSLEIVDNEGRVRASIKVQPAETFRQTGKYYPETVVLRLIDENGRPEVKLSGSKQGGGLSLVGERDETQLLLQAEAVEARIKLQSAEGKQQILKP